jgi:hypothetical protein
MPQKPPVVSPKTKKLTLSFSFDTNDVMTGRWHVQLLGGGEMIEESRLIDTVAGVSGVAVGNRMELYIASSFAGTDDVTVQISGTIIQLPKTISASNLDYVIDGWTIDRTATKTIKRADFDKTQTLRVVQGTDDVSFVLSTTSTGTSATTHVDSTTGGIEVGIEESAEVGGTVGVAGGKDTVKVAAKAAYSVTSSDQNTTGTGTAQVRQANFTAKKVRDAAPDIISVI